jgi:hypothetical protein
MKTAVVTMTYNEPLILPRWIQYYGQQFGHSNLFILDHGSTEPVRKIADDCNYILIERWPKLDEFKRRDMMEDFTGFLLRDWDQVIISDTDEFLTPSDPKVSLSEALSENKSSALWATGLNLVHRENVEADFNPTEPILRQRKFFQLVASESKPLVVREKVRWTPGFHYCNIEPNFGSLLLVHLKLFDKELALARHAINQKIQFTHESHGTHWHESMEQVTERFEWFANATVEPLTAQAIKGWNSALLEKCWRDQSGIWRFPLEIQSSTLFERPNDFLIIF